MPQKPEESGRNAEFEEVFEKLESFARLEEQWVEALCSGPVAVGPLMERRGGAITELTRAIEKLGRRAHLLQGAPEWEEVNRRAAEVLDIVKMSDQAVVERREEILGRLEKIRAFKQMLEKYPNSKPRSTDPKFLDRMG